MKNVSKIKRIGIFCFYDKEGVVDKYVEFLLHELNYCLNRLVIVINGKISNIGKMILEKYTDELYIRENNGFDSGAYKDAIVNIIGWECIQEYDELVLCNDTFYGPFKSFELIFSEMQNECADFWGLTYYDNRITNHIQSYFLVYRKRIINGSSMINYMNKYISLVTKEIADVYNEFELGLFQYLVKQGYTFTTYSKNNPFDIFQCSNICMKKSNVPILKKKVFSSENFVHTNVLDTLKYISQNNNYDLDLILSNISRIYNLKITKQEIDEFNSNKEEIVERKYDVAKISDKNIKELIWAKKKIYVYGLGIISGKISKIIAIHHGKINGYVVSDDQLGIPDHKYGVRVYRLSEIYNTDNVVIIVALNKKHTHEVTPYIKGFKEVMFLW